MQDEHADSITGRRMRGAETHISARTPAETGLTSSLLADGVANRCVVLSAIHVGRTAPRALDLFLLVSLGVLFCLSVFGSALAAGAQDYLLENSVAWRIKTLRNYKDGVALADAGSVCDSGCLVLALAFAIVVTNSGARKRMNGSWLLIAVVLFSLNGIATYTVAHRCGAAIGERLQPRVTIPPGLGFKDHKWIPSE